MATILADGVVVMVRSIKDLIELATELREQ